MCCLLRKKCEEMRRFANMAANRRRGAQLRAYIRKGCRDGVVEKTHLDRCWLQTDASSRRLADLELAFSPRGTDQQRSRNRSTSFGRNRRRPSSRFVSCFFWIRACIARGVTPNMLANSVVV